MNKLCLFLPEHHVPPKKTTFRWHSISSVQVLSFVVFFLDMTCLGWYYSVCPTLMPLSSGLKRSQQTSERRRERLKHLTGTKGKKRLRKQGPHLKILSVDTPDHSLQIKGDWIKTSDVFPLPESGINNHETCPPWWMKTNKKEQQPETRFAPATMQQNQCMSQHGVVTESLIQWFIMIKFSWLDFSLTLHFYLVIQLPLVFKWSFNLFSKPKPAT